MVLYAENHLCWCEPAALNENRAESGVSEVKKSETFAERKQ